MLKRLSGNTNHGTREPCIVHSIGRSWKKVAQGFSKLLAKKVARENWNGFANIFKATADEVAEATSRIKNYRTANNLKGGNYGYLEGTVKSKVIDSKMWRSVPLDVAENEIHIFEAIKVQGSTGKEWLRITDSEYRMLNKLASDLGATRGNKYVDITLAS